MSDDSNSLFPNALPPPAAPGPTLPQWYTYADVAQVLRVKVNTVHKWVSQGRVPGPTHFGGAARFPAETFRLIMMGAAAPGTFKNEPGPRSIARKLVNAPPPPTPIPDPPPPPPPPVTSVPAVELDDEPPFDDVGEPTVKNVRRTPVKVKSAPRQKPTPAKSITKGPKEAKSKDKTVRDRVPTVKRRK